jgi:hypothetical protein
LRPEMENREEEKVETSEEGEQLKSVERENG